tara:strand:- start:6656 stop:7390 length:735 start_codon:yes stop_codon:yes gene_type:complete
MSQNTVTLKEVINDFKVTIEDADHIANSSDRALHNIAKRGIREIGFDIAKKIKTVKLDVGDNDTVELPSDFVDVCKVGLVTEEGIIVALIANENITTLSATANTVGEDNEFDTLIFENYLHNGTLGRLYGIGGGHAPGHYRMNLEENRIEIGHVSNISEVVLEYISDPAKLENPDVHVYAEEALRCYMYYKLIERKSGVPANEKARARTEYYNELRKARARLSTFTKENALATIRKNFMLAPKY